jgi:hypothetical protein
VGGPEAANAKEKTYNKTCASLFNSICKKYDNLTEVDKLAAVQKKIQNVQLVMQENVSLALENCVKLESIEAATGYYYCFYLQLHGSITYFNV